MRRAKELSWPQAMRPPDTAAHLLQLIWTSTLQAQPGLSRNTPLTSSIKWLVAGSHMLFSSRATVVLTGSFASWFGKRVPINILAVLLAILLRWLTRYLP